MRGKFVATYPSRDWSQLTILTTARVHVFKKKMSTGNPQQTPKKVCKSSATASLKCCRLCK